MQEDQKIAAFGSSYSYCVALVYLANGAKTPRLWQTSRL